MNIRVMFMVLGSIMLLITVSAQAEATKSADEIAKELANPNTPLASLNFKFQYRLFKGDLPDADNQDGSLVLFQPSFPFPLSNGDLVFFRPAIPLIADQPVFNGIDFDSESGMGDIVFDLAYAPKNDAGLLIAYGIVSSLPTATNDELKTNRYTLGPEFLIGKLTPKYVLGAFPNHQWSVAGSGSKDISLTTMQIFATLLPGGGWNYGTSPIMTYDWKGEEWTVPLNLNAGKTVIMGGRPWKLSVELNYYVDQPDAFGPEYMIGINITPVVENSLAGWFK